MSRSKLLVYHDPEAELALYRATPKRVLWDVALHFASAYSGEYEDALEDGRGLAELRNWIANAPASRRDRIG